jgi:hypothetical protein
MILDHSTARTSCWDVGVVDDANFDKQSVFLGMIVQPPN